MKRILLIPLLILIALSCKKDDHSIYNVVGNYQYLPSIKAGQTMGDGISYQDIIPDDTLKTSPSLGVFTQTYDLNADGVNDFELTHSISSPFMLGYKYSSLYITPLGSNSVSVSSIGTQLANSLLYNEDIDSNNVWSDSTAFLYSYSWSMSGTTNTSGYWYYNGDYYIGVRIKSGEKLFYGWMDIKTANYYSFSSCIVTQYAITIPYRE